MALIWHSYAWHSYGTHMHGTHMYGTHMYGTPAWMAPEVAFSGGGGGHSPAADVWAWGLILVSLVSAPDSSSFTQIICRSVARCIISRVFLIWSNGSSGRTHRKRQNAILAGSQNGSSGRTNHKRQNGSSGRTHRKRQNGSSGRTNHKRQDAKRQGPFQVLAELRVSESLRISDHQPGVCLSVCLSLSTIILCLINKK
jgi:serine/threonine protein kinase